MSLSSPPGYGCATDVTRRRRRRRKETQPAGTATLPVTHWSVTLNTRAFISDCNKMSVSRHPKPPSRGNSCLSLVLYGIRMGSEGLVSSPVTGWTLWRIF